MTLWQAVLVALVVSGLAYGCSSDQPAMQATATPGVTAAPTQAANVTTPLVGGSPPPSAPTPSGTAVAPPPVNPPANLTERLQRIVVLNDSGRLAPTVAAISSQVDLPATGPSSLAATPDGKLLVDVRLAPGANATALQPAGQVLSSTPGLATVAIEPSRLRELAVLPAVQSVREVIRPSPDSRP
jgi:hypothetical protein